MSLTKRQKKLERVAKICDSITKPKESVEAKILRAKVRRVEMKKGEN